mmetsp:Transcript_17602/g.45798  ORF Transcript_17602/g.45798 Transcript_17602/m.45798 type:complete len:255 (+) Transcript_17602:817-1581(+)
MGALVRLCHSRRHHAQACAVCSAAHPGRPRVEGCAQWRAALDHCRAPRIQGEHLTKAAHHRRHPGRRGELLRGAVGFFPCLDASTHRPRGAKHSGRPGSRHHHHVGRFLDHGGGGQGVCGGGGRGAAAAGRRHPRHDSHHGAVPPAAAHLPEAGCRRPAGGDLSRAADTVLRRPAAREHQRGSGEELLQAEPQHARAALPPARGRGRGEDGRRAQAAGAAERRGQGGGHLAVHPAAGGGPLLRGEPPLPGRLRQ